MVRQGLRSLQNGRASLLLYPPPSPKSREAERPGSRKAERRRPGKPGGRKGRNADWAEVRPIRRNLVCVNLILPVCHVAIRHATTQKPRGDKNILCSLLIIFQSKLRVCLSHPPSHSNGHILKRETVLMPIPLEPGYVKFRAPKSDNLSFNMRPPGVRFGRRCEASTHKRWGSHPYEISNFPQCSGVRVQAHT